MFKIVVGYDFTELADEALMRAATLAESRGKTAESGGTSEIHALCVLDRSLRARGLLDTLDVRSADKIRSRLAGLIEQMPGRLATEPIERQLDLYAHVRIGDAADEILNLAQEHGADMIVVGTHGNTGAKRLLLGSVAENVVRNAGCPVLIARKKTYAEPVDDPRFRPESADTPALDHHLEPHVYHYRPGIAPRRPVEWPLY